LLLLQIGDALRQQAVEKFHVSRANVRQGVMIDRNIAANPLKRQVRLATMRLLLGRASS
jgi:hypothetical protein